MHICNKIVRKFTFKCDFVANGLHSAMMQPTHSEIYNSSISATLRTLSFCFSIKQPIRITDSFSIDYADLPYHLITSSPHFHGLISPCPYTFSPASVEIISMHFLFPEGIPNPCRRSLFYGIVSCTRRWGKA
mgnify:CR=1 FL=1